MTQRNPMIVCLDMDCFFVSVERQLNPHLKDTPVIVGAKPEKRGVVAACSYETRKAGIYSGMSSYQAKIRCPEAVFVSPRISVYKAYSNAVYRFLKHYVPVVHQASIDEFYLDLSGCEKESVDGSRFMWSLKNTIDKELGLPSSIGIG